MRLVFSLILGAIVLSMAFWAYQENYRTRQVLSDVRNVQHEIGALNEQLSVLNAEWAYLNRPARLRELVELNFEKLQLLPMSPDHFGQIEQVAYPPEPIPDLPLLDGEFVEGVIVAMPAAADGEQFP